jgi:hypothetical protein
MARSEYQLIYGNTAHVESRLKELNVVNPGVLRPNWKPIQFTAATVGQTVTLYVIAENEIGK